MHCKIMKMDHLILWVFYCLVGLLSTFDLTCAIQNSSRMSVDLLFVPALVNSCDSNDSDNTTRDINLVFRDVQDAVEYANSTLLLPGLGRSIVLRVGSMQVCV